MISRRKSWNRRAGLSLITSRSGDVYDHVFDVEPSERVVDLGAGFGGYDRDTVVGVDYKYRFFGPQKRRSNIACLFQNLPFADESFDKAVANSSFEKLSGGCYQATSEALRVVRPGGNVQIWAVGLRSKEKAAKLEDEQRVNYRRDHKNTRRNAVTSAALNSPFYFNSLMFHGNLRTAAVGASTVAAGFLFYSLQRTSGTLTIERTAGMSEESNRLKAAEEILAAYKVVRNTRFEPKTSSSLPDITGQQTLLGVTQLDEQLDDGPYDWSTDPSMA